MRPLVIVGLNICFCVAGSLIFMQRAAFAYPIAKPTLKSMSQHEGNIENWYNAFLEDVTDLKSFETRLKKTANPTEKLGFTLGLAQHQLRKKNATAARDLLLKIKPQALQNTPPLLNQIYALLLAKAYEQMGRFDSAIQTLRPLTANLQNNTDLKRFILSAYVRNLIGAKLIAEANSFLSTYSGFIAREFSDFELGPERLEIAKTQLELGFKDGAFYTLMDLARLYPITDESVGAVKLLNQHFCERFQLEALWSTSDEKRKHARDILYYRGGVADARQFVFALANFDENQPVPKAQPEDVTEDELHELVETLDFLVSAREYKLAHRLAVYLRKVYVAQKLTTMDAEFDRFLFLEGRSFNSTEQPSQAVKSYRSLFTQFPSSRYAEQARARYSYSLHFNKNYKEASHSFLTMPGNAKRKLINTWNAMWSAYLADDTKTAAPLLQKFIDKRRLDPDAIASATYWKARLAEKKQLKNEGRMLLTSLASAQHSSFYSLLARWRLEQMPAAANNNNRNNQSNNNATAQIKQSSVQVVNVPANNNTAGQTAAVDFNFLKHLTATQNLPEKYRNTEMLVSFGLAEYANALVEQPASFVANENEARLAGSLGARSLNFKVASLIPRRSIWALRNIPNTDDDLKKEFTQNSATWKLSFPLAYGPYVKKVGEAMGVDPLLILSLMRAESNYDADAESQVGALGLLQIMPHSGSKIASALRLTNFEPRSLLKPSYNIYFSGWYVSRLVKHYKGNIPLAIASYNAGPEAVDRWIKQHPQLSLDEFLENIPFKETKTYVSRVLLYLDVYKRLYGASPNFGLVAPVSQRLPTPLTEPDLF